MVNIFLIYTCHFIVLWKADIEMEEVKGFIRDKACER